MQELINDFQLRLIQQRLKDWITIPWFKMFLQSLPCFAVVHVYLYFEMKSAESRVLLNKTLAIEIYQTKLTLAAPTSFESCLKDSRIKMRGKSAKLSKIYGVSAKTIRDIWNRKTWANATNHLWDQEPMFMEVSFHLQNCMP